MPELALGKGPNRQGGRTIRAVSADGKRAVTERDFSTDLVFEIATGKDVGTAPHDPTSPRVTLSADGKVLAYSTFGKDATREVVVWNVEGNVQLARVTGIKGQFVNMVLSSDGKTLLTTSTGYPNPTAVQLWEVASGKLIATLPDDHVGGPAVFSPDGKTLATADGSNGAVQFWDAATGKQGALLLGRSERLVQLAFSPDGKTLAALGANWAIERWALPDGKLLKSTPFPAADLLQYATVPGVIGLAFADNDRAIAWGALWESALVWEAPSGKLLTPITGHVGAVTAVRFTAGGKEVVTAGVDRRVLRWDAATGRRTEVIVASQKHQSFNYLAQLPYHSLSPDGTRGLRDRALFDVAAGEELFSLPISNPTPSDDFRRIAGLSRVRAANGAPAYEVWDPEDRRRVARLELPTGAPSIRTAQSRSVRTARDWSPSCRSTNREFREFRGYLSSWLGGTRKPASGWAKYANRPQGSGCCPAATEENKPHLTLASNNSGVVLATPDGKLWVADYERGVRGETIAELTREQRFTHPTVSPDGKTFAVGAAHRQIRRLRGAGVRLAARQAAAHLHRPPRAGHGAGVPPGRQDARLRVG